MEWKPVPDFADYEVSEYGIIRRVNDHPRCPKKYPKGYVIPQWDHKKVFVKKDGSASTFIYKSVSLHIRGIGTKDIFVHRVVASSFIGPRPSTKHEVAHGDGDRFNNHYRNLRWATASENQNDRNEHQTSNRGERHGRSKLKPEQVLEIRAKAADGAIQAALAREYSVDNYCIHAIVHRKTWKHI